MGDSRFKVRQELLQGAQRADTAVVYVEYRHAVQALGDVPAESFLNGQKPEGNPRQGQLVGMHRERWIEALQAPAPVEVQHSEGDDPAADE